jgi:deoxyribodipyrimidine photolyase-like uncharacterized protein
MFVDGYDWVMVPNVIGMTLHADGGFVGTKPYAASANYINSMSDYCGGCAYDPKQTVGANACPYNALYWDFIARNEVRFAKNTRMSLPLRNWQRRDDDAKRAIRVARTSASSNSELRKRDRLSLRKAREARKGSRCLLPQVPLQHVFCLRVIVVEIECAQFRNLLA